MLAGTGYGLEVVAKTGDTTAQGDSITAILDASINDLGQVAFLGNTAAGTAVFASGVRGAGVDRLSFFPSATRVFASPRINNSGQVVARDRVTGSPPPSLVRTWDAHNPGNFNIVASTTHTNSSFTYDSVLLPTIADDESVAFVGLTGGAVNTALYLDNNTTPTSGEVALGSLSGGGFRPLNAEGGRVVVEDSPSSHDRILLYGSTPGLVANYPNFTDLGASAGITGTGNLVAFYGDLSAAGATALNASKPAGFTPLDPGPGIFVSLDAVGGVRPMVRIAGISGNGFLDPGETYTDTNGNAQYDPGEPDSGPFSGFVPDARVGIGYSMGRQIRRYTVGFMATATTAVTGLYSTELNAIGAVPTLAAASAVAGVGGTVTGLAGTISSITLADPVNDSGQLVFSVQMSGGQQAVIRAGHKDTDKDGLYDDWEDAQGIDLNGNGTIDVALPGANSQHKDLYVEVDSMAGMAPLAQLLPLAMPPGLLTNTFLDGVVAAFYSSPVSNPDNVDGINLHLDLSETRAIPAALWGNIDLTNDWPAEFDTLKTPFFGNNGDTAIQKQARALAYRYCVFAQSFQTNIGGNLTRGVSGIAEIGGNDFTVTMGGWASPGNPVTGSEQAGTFMHEFGHTLGLHHGGTDDIRYKPNYFSIMNYSWQTPVRKAGYAASPALNAYYNAWRLDYSHGTLNTVNEASLDESVGLGGDPTIPVPIGINVVAGVRNLLTVPQGTPGAPGNFTDYNQSGALDAVPVQAEVLFRDNDGFFDNRPLSDSNDWSALLYNFRISKDSADGIHDPEVNEVTDAMVNDTAELFSRVTSWPADTQPPTASDPKFRFDLPSQPIAIRFSEDVEPTLAPADLTVTNLATGQDVAVASASFDLSSKTAIFTLAAALADGNYRATLAAGSVADAAGNALAAKLSFDFFVLAGDANHDRTVGFADLVAVAQNYGATGGATFDKGDFNYDGRVDFADLVTVAQRYGTSLLPPVLAPLPPPSAPAVALASSAPNQKSNKSLFSVIPVTKAPFLKPLPRRQVHRGAQQ